MGRRRLLYRISPGHRCESEDDLARQRRAEILIDVGGGQGEHISNLAAFHIHHPKDSARINPYGATFIPWNVNAGAPHGHILLLIPYS